MSAVGCTRADASVKDGAPPCRALPGRAAINDSRAHVRTPPSTGSRCTCAPRSPINGHTKVLPNRHETAYNPNFTASAEPSAYDSACVSRRGTSGWTQPGTGFAAGDGAMRTRTRWTASLAAAAMLLTAAVSAFGYTGEVPATATVSVAGTVACSDTFAVSSTFLDVEGVRGRGSGS